MTAVDETTNSFSHELDDEIWGTTPSISFNGTPPITVEGLVTDQERGFQTDITTRKVQTWEDGRPKRKVVLHMKFDDGTNNLLHVNIPSALFAAIKEAVESAGVTGPVGSRLSVTYTGDGKPTKKGLNPPKEFDALIELVGEPPF